MSESSAFLLEESGFTVYALRSRVAEVKVVELGAKIISLKNLETGREWMWRPPGPLRLFHNEPGDLFDDSPLVGADECLPTISPGKWKGRNLPDHGEVWGVRWDVDQQAWDQGSIKMGVKTPISPFVFERTVRLFENEVRLDYRIKNVAREQEPFLWSFHPLLGIKDGDRIELPEHIHSVRVESAGRLPGMHPGSIRPWPKPIPDVDLEWLDLGTQGSANTKLFAEPLNEGRAALVNSRSGERLVFDFDTRRNPALGLWITRGGWNGYEHVALEPTNLASDSLADAAPDAIHALGLSPEGEKTWTVKLRLEHL